MIDLNSLLLEGCYCNAHATGEDDKGKFVEFKIKTLYRYYDASESEPQKFTVVCRGKIADVFQENITLNRKMRIVGKIRKRKNKVIIEAQHIELKPI